jgi:Zn-dependent protease with chaperone function
MPPAHPVNRKCFAAPAGPLAPMLQPPTGRVRIYVFRGLLGSVRKPEELAGVLAHEMAHVTRRHGLRQLIAAKGPYCTLRLFISHSYLFA